ncbi:MAG: hypothetical protein V4450_07950 [Bacteroidota bacterium]
MRPTCFTKKTNLLLLAIVLLLQVSAQTSSISYHELTAIQFRNPVLIGKTGNGFAMTDVPVTEGTPVYLLDRSLAVTKKIFVPSAAYEAMGYTSGNNLHFLWQERLKDSAKLRLLQVTDEGSVTTIEKKILAPGTSGIYQQMVTDKNSRYFFFHTWFTGTEQLVLKGILLDSSLATIQQIDSRFDYDDNLQRQTQVLLDVKGNLHVALYDKLTNYRLSAGVQLYTIPYGSKTVVSEKFQFDKVKFYDLLFFDNPVTEEVQLSGFYYDGSTKIKTGLVSIRFPYARKKPIHEKFIVFSEAQRKKLLEGMVHVRRKNDVMDFMKLRDIIEENGQVFLSAWILDIPNYLLVKDNQKETMRNTEIAEWVRPGKEGTLDISRFSSINPRVGTRLASDLLPNEATGLSINNVQNSTYNPPITQVSSRTRPGLASLPTRDPDLKVNWISPKKFAYFTITADNAMWMQVLPGNFPVASVSYQFSMWDYPLVENDHLYFTHLQQPILRNTATGIQSKTTPPLVSLISMRSDGVTVRPDTTMNLSQMRLGKPLKIAAGKYLLPYQQLEKNQNGLAIFEIRP